MLIICCILIVFISLKLSVITLIPTAYNVLYGYVNRALMEEYACIEKRLQLFQLEQKPRLDF